MSASFRRVKALCLKESYQIMRDPSSILIAFIMPVMMLCVFSYAINLDSNFIRIGFLSEDNGTPALRFEQSLNASSAFEMHHGISRDALQKELMHGTIRGIIILNNQFSEKVLQGQGAAAIQVLTDGSEPNTAQFVVAYVQGALANWQREIQGLQNPGTNPVIAIHTRSWFNPSTISRNFLLPGSIAVVMTIIGALLTSLVIAREWERGTMEALLATPITRTEFLLSKIIPYYALGILAMLLCLIVAIQLMQVPFRGSLWMLFIITTLFLGSALGLGLFLSTIFRIQFNAAQAALTSAYLPAMMLSGFVFEIENMPKFLQWFTHIIPARFFTSSLQTLFQAGNIYPILISNSLYLLFISVFWLGMAVKKTTRTLD